MFKLKHLVISFIASASLYVVFGASAHAATFTVAAGNDENTDNSSCALTEAIENINDQATTNTDCSPTGAYGTDDTINLPAGTITLTADLPDITESLIVTGQGESSSFIDGDNNQYQGFGTPGHIGVFTARLFTIRDASAAAIYVCASQVTVEHLIVNNSEVGTGFECNDGNDQILSVDISDAEFVDNVNSGSGGLAGLYAATDSNCTADTAVILNNVKATGNGDNTGQYSGIALGTAENCAGSVDHTVQLVDVESSNNTSYGVAGIYLSTVGADTTLNRVSSTGNEVSGVLDLEGAAPLAGILVSNSLSLVANNITVANNIGNPSPGSDPVITGFTSQSFGFEADMSITNVTFVGNTVINGENAAGNLAYAAIGLVNSLDFTNFIPGTVTNLLAADNLSDGEPSGCYEVVDFGGGPVTIPMNSGGGNIVDNNTCAFAFTQPTDQNNLTGLGSTLSALADNGGYVPTIALKQGSPAIDAGVTIPTLTTDARGETRPQGNAYDSGAYESPYTQAEDEETDSLAETGRGVLPFIVLATLLIITSSTSVIWRIKQRV